MNKEAKNKITEKINEIERGSKELFQMDENEEFMDGEMIHRHGFSLGQLSGLNYALKVMEEL